MKGIGEKKIITIESSYLQSNHLEPFQTSESYLYPSTCISSTILPQVAHNSLTLLVHSCQGWKTMTLPVDLKTQIRAQESAIPLQSLGRISLIFSNNHCG